LGERGPGHVVEPLQLHQRVLALVPDAVPATGLLVVLAERVADPVVGQHDAAQVGVAGEGDAEEVVDLALEPVGALPDPGERRHHRVGAVGLHLELHRVSMLQREEVDHHLDDVSLGPVDGGEILAEVELEAGGGLEEGADLDQPRRLHRQPGVSLGLGGRPDVIAEARLEPFVDLAGRHFTPCCDRGERLA